MRILLFGKYGQLGWELQRTLASLGTVIAIDFPEVDFKKPNSLSPIVDETDPDLIINAIAYTDVDKAESEPDSARLVNATSVGILAEEARHRKKSFIHYSTDYVFDGNTDTPYAEDGNPHPINIYGQTKLEGEQATTQVGGAYLIFRTSWVYSLRQGGFVNKVLQWSRTKNEARIVDDQVGSPTWARMLAEVTAQIIAQSKGDPFGYIAEYTGLYHLAGAGAATRYEWATKILEYDPDRSERVVQQLHPAKSTDFPTVAKRPSYSALTCLKLERSFRLVIPAWQQSLFLALNR